MKGKIGALVFLTAILVLSAATTGIGNTVTVHVQVAGQKGDVLVLHLEKISEDKKTVTCKVTDLDMAMFQYHFGIASVVKYVDLTVTDVGSGYFVLAISKKDLKSRGKSDYVMKLPASVLKKNMDTSALDQYIGAEQLQARVYAKDKYLRTLVAITGVDIAGLNLPEGYMDVFVSYEELLGLYLSGFEVEVVDTPVPTQLESEYHTYPEVVTELSQIESDHSSIAEVFSIGTSYEGRDIPGIKISDNVATNESEPEVFICAMHHARECCTVEVAMYIINQLTDNYGSDPTVTSLVNNREIYIVPIVNPDGKVYDDSGGSSGNGRNWRKNRQPCTGGTGTDLNRNYSYGWGGSGSSGSCTSETFRGYSAFDAPESAAVRDFFNAHPDINVLLTYHSYSRLVLWPWGYTYSSISDEDDRNVHEIMGQEYASYVGYTPQQASDLYLASGTTDDWSYGTTQNDAMPCFSFTVELAGSGFYPPPSILPGMCADNYEGALYFIDCADNPYKVLGGGPEVIITNPSNGATVSGTVNITTSTAGGIDEVKFYIDSSQVKDDTSSPFDYSWDTTTYSEGSHTILAEGYVSGVLKDTDSITVTVQNEAPPSYVDITNPSEGQTVSGTVSVTVDASADITSVTFYVDGTEEATDSTSPFSWSWDTTQETDDSHTVMVEGYVSGELVDSDSVGVTVDNAGECLGTVLLGILLLFGSAEVFKKR
jgi:carboxypeptidase T